MQNLIRFIKKYYHLLLFAILEIIALTALIKFNHYQQAIFFSTANSVSGELLQKKADALSYLSLKEENDRLLGVTNRYFNDSINNNFIVFSSDTFLMKDSSRLPWFSFIPAKVINNYTHKKRNYLTIAGGTKQGIGRNMGVVSQDGVVGIVVDVSENFALVMSLLHDQFKLKPKISDNGYFGELSWDGEDPTIAKIEKISRHYPIKKGQAVVTSAYSRLFPANVPVGTISEVKKYVKKPFADISVKLSTQFGKVQSVYVVKNIYRKEIVELEGETELE
jgi:rod shape-determining protein MreC